MQFHDRIPILLLTDSTLERRRNTIIKIIQALVNGSDWFPYRNAIDTAKTKAYVENYSTYKRSAGNDDRNALLFGSPKFQRDVNTDAFYYYL